MSKQRALVDLERFPDRFSDDEAPTVLYGDRPTPHFAIPRSLLECTETSDSVVTRSADVSGIIPVATAVAPAALTAGPVVPEPAESTLESHEDAFWTNPPRYSPSVQPSAPFSLPPAPQPPRARRLLAKVVFATLFSGTLALLAYEMSTMYGVRWSDVRALVAKIR